MESAVRQVSTHILRQHRLVRRRLPDLATFAESADTATPVKRGAAARRALRILEQDVLAQADVEDAMVASRLGQRPLTGGLRRLRPEHDALRLGTDRLRQFVESPEDESLDVAGLLSGLGDLLRSHLDDEWHSLLPALAELDDERATSLVAMIEDGSSEDDGSLDRLHLPRTLERVTDRLAGSGLSQVAPRAEAAAEEAARRVAAGLAVPGAESLTVSVDLVPVVTSPRVVLLVGRLRSPQIETVLAPVEFEVTLVRDGPNATTMDLRHDVIPARSLPPDVPAHDITAAAVNALAGELALIGIDREPAPWAPAARPHGECRP